MTDAPKTGLSRRGVVASTVALFVGGGAEAAASKSAVSSLLQDLEAARAVGRAMRDQGLSAVGVFEGAAVCDTSRPLAERRRLLREQVRADFAAGRTRRAEGWILSETEAMLCVAIAEEGAA